MKSKQNAFIVLMRKALSEMKKESAVSGSEDKILLEKKMGSLTK